MTAFRLPRQCSVCRAVRADVERVADAMLCRDCVPGGVRAWLSLGPAGLRLEFTTPGGSDIPDPGALT